MKLKLKKVNDTQSSYCYPYDSSDINNETLWKHLIPNDEPELTVLVEFLARAHNWEIEWMKD